MLELLVALLFLVIIFGVLYWAVMLIPLPAPFKQAAQFIVLALCIIVLVSMLFGWMPMPFPHLRRL